MEALYLHHTGQEERLGRMMRAPAGIRAADREGSESAGTRKRNCRKRWKETNNHEMHQF